MNVCHRAPILQRPSVADCGNRNKLYSRKGYYTIYVPAICDAFRFIRWFDITGTGNCHDSTAFNACSLNELLANSDVVKNGKYHLNGDAAYTAKEYMLTPYKGSNLPEDKDAFNFYQSALRINIECAFGLVQSRFGIFWRRMRVKPKRWVPTIEACFKLHNLCLADFYTNNHGGDFVPPANYCYSLVAILGMGRSQRGGITRGDIKLRASICSATRHMGLIRPPGVEENRVITKIRCSENDQDAVDAEIQSHLPSTVL